MVRGACGVNGQSVMHVRVCLSENESVTAPLLDLEVCLATASLSRAVVATTTKLSAQVSVPHTHVLCTEKQTNQSLITIFQNVICF